VQSRESGSLFTHPYPGVRYKRPDDPERETEFLNIWSRLVRRNRRLLPEDIAKLLRSNLNRDLRRRRVGEAVQQG
jgi:hypothetical protein